MEQWAIENLKDILHNYTAKEILVELQKQVQAEADTAREVHQSEFYEWNCNVSASCLNTAINTMNEAGVK